MNVARQPAERDAREPVPPQAGKNAQYANNDQETVHGAQSLSIADGAIIGLRKRFNDIFRPTSTVARKQDRWKRSCRSMLKLQRLMHGMVSRFVS
jgi:hypothetical protein